MFKVDSDYIFKMQTTMRGQNGTNTTESTSFSSGVEIGQRELQTDEMKELLEHIGEIDEGGAPEDDLLSIKTRILFASDAQRVEIIQFIEMNNIPSDDKNEQNRESFSTKQKRELINFCKPCAPLPINGVNSVTLAQTSAVSTITKLPQYLQNGDLYKGIKIHRSIGEEQPVHQALNIIACAWGEIEKLDRTQDRLQIVQALRDSVAFGDIGKLLPVLAQPVRMQLVGMSGLETPTGPFCSFLGSTTASTAEVEAYLAGMEKFVGYFSTQPKWIEFSEIYQKLQNSNLPEATSIKELDRQLALLSYGNTVKKFMGRTNGLYIFYRANEFCQTYERAVMAANGGFVDNGPFNKDYNEEGEVANAIRVEKDTGIFIRQLSSHIRNNLDGTQKETYRYSDICATLSSGQLKEIAAEYDSISGGRFSMVEVVSVAEEVLRADPAHFDASDNQELLIGSGEAV